MISKCDTGRDFRPVFSFPWDISPLTRAGKIPIIKRLTGNSAAGSALGSGPRGREFESPFSDQTQNVRCGIHYQMETAPDIVIFSCPRRHPLCQHHTGTSFSGTAPTAPFCYVFRFFHIPSGMLGKCEHYTESHFVGSLADGITNAREHLVSAMQKFSVCRLRK